MTSTEGNKKLYGATEEGQGVSEGQPAVLKAIFGRIQAAGKMFGRGRSPQIKRAIHEFEIRAEDARGTRQFDARNS